MPYNEQLAERVRRALSHLRKVEEKKMFGGIAFMVNDKMCVTVGADRIMCRIDPDVHADALQRKGSSTVMMRGMEYKGYVHVDEASLADSRDLDFWIGLALDYNTRARASKKKR